MAQGRSQIEGRVGDLPYRRVLLKLSGEALAGSRKIGIDPLVSEEIALALFHMQQAGLEVGVVVGGGNIFRGIEGATSGIGRVPADHMGMFATVINGIALQEILKRLGARVRVMNALGATDLVEPFNWAGAMRALGEREIVIFVGGTGHPFFTTDSCAALRAIQIEAEVLLKATNVDGVYDKDPHHFPDAKRFSRITYEEVLELRLAVMDLTAIALCRENRMPIKVFSIGSLWDAVSQLDFGSIVEER